MSKPEFSLDKIVFGLFILLVLSLGLMKPTLQFGTVALTPTDLLFPLVFVMWLITVVVGGKQLRWRSEYWAFGFYLLALALSSVFSVDRRLSFVRLLGVTYLVLLAVVTSSLVTTYERLRIASLAWLFGALVPVAAALIGIALFYINPGSGIVEFLTYHAGAVPVSGFPRVNSTFASPSMFCNYLTVMMALVFISARQDWIGRNLAILLSATIAIAALFTMSIAMGGFFLVTGICLFVATPKSFWSRGGLMVGIAVALAFLAISPFALSFDHPGPSSRALVWHEALNTFLSAPVTGKGLGTPAAGVTFQNYDGSTSLLTDAHNVYLNVSAQAGILGLAGIVAVLVMTLKNALGGAQRATASRQIQVCLGAAFFVAFVYDGLTGSFEDARHLWVLMGLISGANLIENSSERGR